MMGSNFVLENLEDTFLFTTFAHRSVRNCLRSANATPHSDLGQRIASELAWLSLNRSFVTIEITTNEDMNRTGIIYNSLNMRDLQAPPPFMEIM